MNEIEEIKNILINIFEDECCCNEGSFTKENFFEICHLFDDISEHTEQLENIRKEAIEYINEDIKGNYFRRYDDEVYKMCDDLLNILNK